MENPFVYHGIASGDAFCNRKAEIDTIMQYARTSHNLLIYSHRRYGKSSLILRAFDVLKNQNSDIRTMRVDLFGTLSERDFCITFYRAMAQLEGGMQKLINFLKQGAKQLRLTLGVDALFTGGIPFTPTLESSDTEIVFDDLMKIVAHYSEKRRVIIAFDEFQEIASYSPGNFEKLLRSYIQTHDRTSYIFSGSQQHLISQMFNDKAKAFYQLADTLALPVIDTDDFIDWMHRLFSVGEFNLPELFLRKIVMRYKNHPMFIQKFCHHLWIRLVDSSYVDDDALDGLADEIELLMLERKELDYQSLWQTFSLNQKRAIKLIIFSAGKGVFSSRNLARAGISTSSIASRAFQSLIAKDVICKNSNYSLYDVLFEKWLKKRLIF
jgi:hypothetical protein